MKEILGEYSISFEPEVVEILAHAFEDACIVADAEALLTSTEEENLAATRRVLARRIIDLAIDGERDPTRLTVRSLEYLARARRQTDG
jgi:hypothetical protein